MAQNLTKQVKLEIAKASRIKKRRNSNYIRPEKEKRTIHNLYTEEHVQGQTNLMANFAKLGMPGGSLLGRAGARGQGVASNDKLRLT